MPRSAPALTCSRTPRTSCPRTPALWRPAAPSAGTPTSTARPDLAGPPAHSSSRAPLDQWLRPHQLWRPAPHAGDAPASLLAARSTGAPAHALQIDALLHDALHHTAMVPRPPARCDELACTGYATLLRAITAQSILRAAQAAMAYGNGRRAPSSPSLEATRASSAAPPATARRRAGR